MLCRTRFPLHKMYQLPCKPTGIELLVYAHIKSRLPSGVDNHSLVQGQLLIIWHRMLIYHTTWILGP